jgi:hypothetical protein
MWFPQATSMPPLLGRAVASDAPGAEVPVTGRLISSLHGVKAVRPSVLTSAEEELPNGLVAR